MNGLIIKELRLLLKGVEKKLFVIIIGIMILLFVKVDEYAGLLGSILFAMTIGMQNTMNANLDEKHNWLQYQNSLPISKPAIVLSRFCAMLLSTLISVSISIILSILIAILYPDSLFDIAIISAVLSLLIPIIWDSICFPIIYWFGFRSAQIMGLLIIIPMFYIIKFFEENSLTPQLITSVYAIIAWSGIATIILLFFSYIISLLGFSRKF